MPLLARMRYRGNNDIIMGLNFFTCYFIKFMHIRSIKITSCQHSQKRERKKEGREGEREEGKGRKKRERERGEGRGEPQNASS